MEGIPNEEGLFLYALKIDQFNSGGELLNSGYYDYVFEVGYKVAKIKAKPFLDKNENQVYDSDEFFLNNVTLDLDNDYLAKQKGFFFTEFYLTDLGEYGIQSSNPIWEINHTSGTWSVDIPALELIEEEVPIVSAIEGLAYDISISQSPLICNDYITFDINVVNYSDSDLNNTLLFQKDSCVEDDFVTLNYNTINWIDGSLSWPVESLAPGVTDTSILSFVLNAPDKMPGDILTFTIISVTEIGQNTIVDTIVIDNILLCAFDPNNKVVAPQRKGNLIYEEEYLYYTINFQNLGNHKATDVIILDTFSESFDLETFEVTTTSHFSFPKIEGNLLKVEFPNINLTYADNNSALSKGFVTYKIKPKRDTPNQTKIRNSASIYFDQNAPIYTNETLNVFVKKGSLSELADVKVYPNPFTSEFCVDLGIKISEKLKIEFYNSAGKLIGSTYLEEPLSIIKQLGNVPFGVYFYKINLGDDKEVISGKIVKIE